jgi:hypothetical protein
MRFLPIKKTEFAAVHFAKNSTATELETNLKNFVILPDNFPNRVLSGTK